MLISAGLIGMFPKHLPKKIKNPVEEYEIDGEKLSEKPTITEKPESNPNDAINLKSMNIYIETISAYSNLFM